MSYIYIEVSVNKILEQTQLLKEYAKDSKSSLAPNIKPSIEIYNNLENLGMLNCIALMSDKTMVGFIVLLTSMMPHYSEPATLVESIFILKEHRKFGTGKELIARAEKLVKDKGIKLMFLSAANGSRLEKATRFFGFKKTHATYIKRIDETS